MSLSEFVIPLTPLNNSVMPLPWVNSRSRKSNAFCIARTCTGHRTDRPTSKGLRPKQGAARKWPQGRPTCCWFLKESSTKIKPREQTRPRTQGTKDVLGHVSPTWQGLWLWPHLEGSDTVTHWLHTVAVKIKWDIYENSPLAFGTKWKFRKCHPHPLSKLEG